MSECVPSMATNTEALRALQMIKRHGGLTRQQLAECLECSPAKISMLLKELDELGVVEEGESQDGGSGRRVRQIVLSGKPAQFVGVELGSFEIRVALADFGGTILAKDKIPEDSSIDIPSHVLERLFGLIDSFLAANAAMATHVKGLALALSGVVDPVDGTTRYFRNQKVWEGVPIKKLVEERFGMPCFIDDSSRAMAAAEKRWGCCRNSSCFVLLSLGGGLGAGVYIKDDIFRGCGYAGEIGHMIIDPAGPRCNCGSHGCLESFVSGYALENRARRALSEGVYTSLDAETLTAKTIITAAAQGDKFAFGAVSEMAERLGVGIANVINIFNPEKVVLAGGLSGAGDLLLQPIRQIVRSTALSTLAQHCEIIISPLDEYSAAIGMTDIFTSWSLGTGARLKKMTGIGI